MNDDDLRSLFEGHGDVASANVITDRETGRSRGFGFVEMTDEVVARKAIEAMADFVTEGRTLVVNEAKPRGSGKRGAGGGRRW